MPFSLALSFAVTHFLIGRRDRRYDLHHASEKGITTVESNGQLGGKNREKRKALKKIWCVAKCYSRRQKCFPTQEAISLGNWLPLCHSFLKWFNGPKVSAVEIPCTLTRRLDLIPNIRHHHCTPDGQDFLFILTKIALTAQMTQVYKNQQPS